MNKMIVSQELSNSEEDSKYYKNKDGIPSKIY